MNLPLITWSCIVGLIAIIFLINLAKAIAGRARGKHRLHVLELGNEREELFIPGDILKKNDNDYDDSDYDF